MSLKEELKQQASEEKEKFSNMSTADKLWYIGEYYKFHILAIVLVVGLSATIGSTVYRNLKYDTSLYGFVINNRSEAALDMAVFEEGFSEYMGYSKYNQLTLESSYIAYGDDSTEFSYASMAKISALVASKELDFMITDEENFLHYVEMGAFVDFEKVLPEDLQLAASDRLLYAADESGEQHAFAIALDGTEFADRIHLSDDCKYFGIISNSTRTDTGLDLLRYVFSLE